VVSHLFAAMFQDERKMFANRKVDQYGFVDRYTKYRCRFQRYLMTKKTPVYILVAANPQKVPCFAGIYHLFQNFICAEDRTGNHMGCPYKIDISGAFRIFQFLIHNTVLDRRLPACPR
jgi:hypothetical protein